MLSSKQKAAGSRVQEKEGQGMMVQVAHHVGRRDTTRHLLLKLLEQVWDPTSTTTAP